MLSRLVVSLRVRCWLGILCSCRRSPLYSASFILFFFAKRRFYIPEKKDYWHAPPPPYSLLPFLSTNIPWEFPQKLFFRSRTDFPRIFGCIIIIIIIADLISFFPLPSAFQKKSLDHTIPTPSPLLFFKAW